MASRFTGASGHPRYWARGSPGTFRDPGYQQVSLDSRLGSLFGRVRYRYWTWSVDIRGSLVIFRSDPAEPKRLQMLGPWNLSGRGPMGAREVRAFALAIAIELDGEIARDSFVFAK